MQAPYISRRSLLATAVTGGAAALLAQPAGMLDAALGSPSAAGDATAAIDPTGVHQGGITTPGQQHLQLGAFDLKPGITKAQLVALLQDWQLAIGTLAKGQPLPGADTPATAPFDTGEALGQYADRLTITIGFGPSLFDGRFGLATQRPAALVDIPAFTGDALNAALSNGDLSVQCCAENRLVAGHALRALARIGQDRATLRWVQQGFNEAPAQPGQGAGRNLFGFKDGTANLDAGDPVRMARNVWVDPSDGPAWMAGGTYQVYRRVYTKLRLWDESSLSEQEDSIGRRRLSGAPFGGVNETDRVDNALTPVTSHIRLANPRTGQASEDERILRRGYSFHDGLDATGEYDAGLAFIAYQRDPRRQFVPMQTRLAESDALNEYLVHTASAIFAVPPGTTAAGFIGETLLGTAPPRVTVPNPAADLGTPPPGSPAPAPAPAPGPAPAPAPGGTVPRPPAPTKPRKRKKTRRPLRKRA